MLKITPRDLPAEAISELAGHQATADGSGEFAARVEHCKDEWTRLRRKAASALGPSGSVVETLKAMCFGIERCMYCEDSIAHQIEHIRPKHHYPDQAFVWSNMLYACQPCNGPKSDRFVVRRAIDDQEESLVRSRGEPPPIGQPLLIDPREDDPLVFFELDTETGRFLIREELSRADRRRAEYSLEILRLNTRSPLPRARRQAFGNYRARLREYVEEKKRARAANEADEAALQRLRDELLRLHHPTVWTEMVRQADEIMELRALFEQAPEARAWRPGAATVGPQSL